jgi:UNC-50 family
MIGQSSSVSDLSGVGAVYSAGARMLPEGLQRFVLWSHMDFECAWSDMVYLIVDPSRV